MSPACVAAVKNIKSVACDVKSAGRILSLPLYPELTDEQIVSIAEQVNAFL